MIHPASIRSIEISSSIVALFFTSIASSVPAFPSARGTSSSIVQQNGQPQTQDPAHVLLQQGLDLIRTRQFNEAVEVLRQAKRWETQGKF